MAVVPKRLRGPQTYTPDSADYWRARVLYFGLPILIAASVLIAALNFSVFSRPLTGGVALVNAIALGLVWILFQRSLRLEVAAWLLVLITLGVMVVSIHQAGGQGYGLIWLTLFPPLAFFLLGKPGGLVLSTLVLGYGLVHFLGRYAETLETPFTPHSLMNLAFALGLMLLFLSYYEKARSQAQKMLELRQFELAQMASMDSLTNVYNRRVLDEALEREIDFSSSGDIALSAVLLDIDHFKAINDRYGHAAGDRMLRSVAEQLSAVCREPDIVGRWGGEEFLVICPNTSREGARQLAERVRISIAEIDDAGIGRVTASLGVSELAPDDSRETLMRRIDKALYKAKSMGRNRVEVA